MELLSYISYIKESLENAELLIDELLNEDLQELIGTDIGPEVGQRSLADKIEIILQDFLTKNCKYHCKLPTTVRTTEDILMEFEGLKLYIDVKSTDLSKVFHMPNLISIDKFLKNFKPESKNRVGLILVESNKSKITDIRFTFLQNIDTKSLQVSNLGKGQIQIKNILSVSYIIHKDYTDFYSEMKNKHKIFLQKQIDKFHKELKKYDDD